MHSILTIYKKELRSFFTSPMAYIFLVVFALVNGYFFTNTFFLYNQSDMRALFGIVPLVYLFFIPAVSMGLISREKSLGTIEIISTLPVRERDKALHMSPVNERENEDTRGRRGTEPDDLDLGVPHVRQLYYHEIATVQQFGWERRARP